MLERCQMSTVEEVKNSNDIAMTGRALDLLGCFQGGVDDVVQQLAEDYAKQRQMPSFAGQVVMVDVEDVRQAGQKLIEIIRDLVAKGQLPADLESRVQSMGECLNCK